MGFQTSTYNYLSLAQSPPSTPNQMNVIELKPSPSSINKLQTHNDSSPFIVIQSLHMLLSLLFNLVLVNYVYFVDSNGECVSQQDYKFEHNFLVTKANDGER